MQIKKNESLIGNTLEESLHHGTENFNIKIYSNPVDISSPLLASHWHKEFEIIYVTAGHLTFGIDGKDISITAGQAILVDRQTIHSCRFCHKNNSRFISIVFGEKLLFPVNSDIVYQQYIRPLILNQATLTQCVAGKTDWEQDILRLIRNTIELLNEQKHAYELQTKICLLSIFYVLIRENAFTKVGECEKNADIRMREALTYIHENYSQNITMQEMADKLGICIEHFIRCFRERIGETPKSYLVSYRIRRVIFLIETQNNTITEIAEKCGFSDMSYFSRCFKKKTGMTPLQYRRTHGKDDINS